MRFYFFGPRIGFIRTGVSFDPFRGRFAPFGSHPLPSTGGYVYVISGAHGLCKIGISGDPDARIATLRTSSPYALDLAYVTPAQDAFTVEQEAHQMLSRFRANGEWFGVTPMVAIRAVQEAAQRTGDSLTHGDMRRDLWPKWLTKNVGYLVWMGIGLMYVVWFVRQVLTSP